MELEYTPAVAKATAPLYEKVKHVIPAVEWPVHAPYVYAINNLKKQQNAVILAHNYMPPQIYRCVSDFRGDSLELARKAAEVREPVIIQAGVHFMAETSKVLCMDKTVVIPDPLAGCSLASSITAADVAHLRAEHPGLPVVTYVNTSAEVKAASDVCCTSSNAKQVVEWAAGEWGTDTVIMIPDKFLAANIAKQTGVKMVAWEKGSCEVHVRFTREEILDLRDAYKNLGGIAVLAHPECSPEVCAEADFTGSTWALQDYIWKRRPPRVALITECSMGANIKAELPDIEFVQPCNLCPHMHRITLPKILHSLQTMETEVRVEREIASEAWIAISRMLEIVPPRPRS